MARLIGLILSVAAVAHAQWQVDQPRPGVLVLRNETGAWGGFSMGVAHQNKPQYQVRKVLDLTALPETVRKQAPVVRLRLYCAIQDYSWNVGDRTHNGLNEAFEIAVNDIPMCFQTSDPRFPARGGPSDPLRADWVDIDLPREVLEAETLEIVIRKLPGGNNDDYVYPGIDNSVPTTHSAVSFDAGETWDTARLNAIDAKGEYIIRLVVSEADLRASATWSLPDAIRDPAGVIAYCGRDGDGWRLEPDRNAYDRARAMTAVVTYEGTPPPTCWLDTAGNVLQTQRHSDDAAILTNVLPAGHWDVDAFTVEKAPGSTLRGVSLEFELPTTEPSLMVDLCPAIAGPAGTRQTSEPVCRLTRENAVVNNGALRAVFRLHPCLALEQLNVAEAARNVLAHPAYTHLFRLKIGDRVYGCRDARVLGIKEVPNGFSACLDIADTGLQGDFTATITQDELRMGFELTNTAADTVQFHLAFPHLAGLQVSDDSADDYYLFPWGGGIIANVPTTLRTAYGENTCWWQMIDVFSPVRGAGLYLRCDDPTGLYKCPSLRKGKRVRGDYSIDDTGRGYLAPEMPWRAALEPAPGIGMAFDYLRRDRLPGQAFRAPDACIGAHSGDWRAALRMYADWSHNTWPPRPYPSTLTRCWHIAATGWGQAPLFKDGAYRTDYLIPQNDVAEMMSWWSWSELGPWNTPMDRLQEELGDAFYNRYKSYWVMEPATGKLMYPLNRGDYDGYMPQWGGLPALRAHIERVREAGIVPMFYTDPLLACATSKMGRENGPTYGIMNPLWKDAYHTGKTPEGYVGSYGSYTMCLDTEWYGTWVAEAVARVCRETGIDGVRLDEYGHRGYVCHSDKHEHMFAEPGHNAWLQALAHNVRQVHAAMDTVRPGLLLTTEFPGNDHMAAALEGAIVYDVRRLGPVRPTPINLFRFFFPECKVFEIDRPPVPQAQAWMLWNGVGAFSAFYTRAQHIMLQENTDAFQSRFAEPLIPTLVPRLYANQFENGDKRIVTFHNATGHTIDQPVFAITPDSEYHYMDLLSGQAITPFATGGHHALKLKMARDSTRVVARLRHRLQVVDQKGQVKGDPAGLVIVAAAPDGSPIARFEPGETLTLGPGTAQPLLLKLLREGQLVDAAPGQQLR